MKTEYDVDWFLNFFGAIPEDKWCAGALERDGTRCANGHLNYCDHGSGFWGNGQTPASVLALDSLTRKYFEVDAPDINNGRRKAATLFPQPTPKQRILAALHDIKRQQEEQAASALDAYELRPLNLTKPEQKESCEAIR